jgi:hypothetical protein
MAAASNSAAGGPPQISGVRAGPTVRVAVWRTIGEAAAIVLARPLGFARLAWLPLAIGTAAVLLQGRLGPTYAAVATALGLYEVPFLLLLVPLECLDWIVSALCLQFFALRWHQVALSGSTRRWPASVFWPAYLRFSLYVLVIFFLGYGGILAGVFLPAAIDVYVAPGTMQQRFLYLPLWMHVFNAVTFLFVLLAGLVSRCALLLPAAAAGKPMTVRAAWRGLKGNAWRLRAVLLAFAAALAAWKWAIAKAPMPVLPDWMGAILGALTREFEYYVVAAFAASALAIFYREIERGSSRAS